MGFGSAFAGEGAGGFSAGEGAGFDTGLERLEPEREPELEREERFLGDGEITFLLGLTIVLPSFSTTSQPLGTVTFPVGVS